MRAQRGHRVTAGAFLVVVVGAILPGCQWLAGEPDPPRPSLSGESDRRTDRGYAPVDEGLPIIGWDGLAWAPVGKHVGESLDEFLGEPVIVEGRMALDESSPYRNQFRLVHQFDGCVSRDHRQHAEDLIHVQLPAGESVQVTDKALKVQGSLRLVPQPSGAPRYELDATAVQPGPPPPDRSVRAHHGKRPHS